MSDFKREDRYLVLKRTDIEKAKERMTAKDWDNFQYVVGLINYTRKKNNKQPLKCVVVESDWPEYEPTWKAIEIRGHLEAN